MKKILFLLLLLPIIGVGVSVRSWAEKQDVFPARQTYQTVKGTSSERIEQPTQVPEVPVRLRIPKIDVNASVESVGLDKEERMDVPQDADNVAWYNLGFKPGQQGNAVMAGHFDKESGAPAVFYKIEQLEVGDEVITFDNQGQAYTFSVVRIVQYPYNNFPLQEVFGPTEKHRLNLITCDGEWDKATKNYSHRTVVYTELIR
jgi:sortase A